MNLIGKKVIHKAFGKGIVKDQDNTHITVEFASKTSKFPYPDAFKKFLVAEDATTNDNIMADIVANEAKIAQEKQRVEEARREAEKKRLEELSQKTTNKTSSKIVKRIERVQGQNMTFLVFQGTTFDAECKGGYIWAPKYNQGGGTCHHWDKLLDVRKGDIIIHCADGYIRAISVVKNACYDAESPTELTQEQLWAKSGRMVDCEYIEIEHPTKHSDYKETIIQYCNVKYAPFDKDGNGNMGYLFELNRELAKIFIEKTVVKNGYLLEYECIKEILK